MTRLTADFVPSTFDELYRYYFHYVVKCVVAWGIDIQNAEDIAQTILTKFFETDALSDYDPERVTVYQGQQRKAVFRTFLSGFVRIYIRHYRDRQGIMLRREGISMDEELSNQSGLAGGGSADNDFRTRADLYMEPYEESYETLHYVDFVQGIRDHLHNDQKLVDLLNAILRQVHTNGAIDTSELAMEFACTRTTIRNRINRLRGQITLLQGEDVSA